MPPPSHGESEMGGSRMRCITATLGLVVFLLAAPAARPAVPRNETPSTHSVLVMDKAHCGELRSITTIPFAFQIDLPLHKPVAEWVAQTFAGKQSPRSGSILTLDRSYVERSHFEFQGALLTEITFPAMDAASKDAGHLNFSLRPAATNTVTVKGGSKQSTGDERAKHWLTRNFRLHIDGLDCTHVMRIEQMTVRQKVRMDTVGTTRKPVLVAGPVELPKLKVTLLDSKAKTWYDWNKEFGLKGTTGKKKEKKGKLTLLAPELKNELATLSFSGLGIHKLAQKISKNTLYVEVELYCEKITFTGGK